MSSRNRRLESQRGFALISALVLSILYFGLMELMLIDSTRAMREADRFRSRVIAANGAENAAELAARQLKSQSSADVTRSEPYGVMHGTMTRSDPQFVLKGSCVTNGAPEMTAEVRVQGRMDMAGGGRIVVDYTFHSQ